jgi:hypothetical protein
MAQTGPTFEGIYASPQSSRSSSFSELGLTLLPSCQSGSRRESHDGGAFQSGRYGDAQLFEGTSGGFGYPSPTPTLESGPLEVFHDAPKTPANVANSEHHKQALSTVANGSTTSLFVPLRPIDRTGRPQKVTVTPTYITTPLQYRPSAPHLHTLVSTGTTLAAAAQLDHLKERNKHLTMERDRFYHLSKPATLRADDGKLEQIRQLKAEIKDATERNGRLQWALQYQTSRANDALALAAKRKAQCEALIAAYNTLATGNPFIHTIQPNQPPSSPTGSHHTGEAIPRRESNYIDLTSPTKPSVSQQVATRKRTSPPAIVVPALTTQSISAAITQDRPLALAKEPPSKRQRTESNTEEQPPARSNEPQSKRQRTSRNNRKQPADIPPPKRQRAGSDATERQPRRQHSMLNSSQMNDIQARLRTELKGKTTFYAWTQEKGAEVENGVDGVEVVDVARDKKGPTDGLAEGPAEDELSESEIAAFDRALEEAGDEESGNGDGDGDSLFGDA